MNRTFKLIPLLTAAIITLSLHSCRVAPTDPDLDAQWQLMTVESESGTVIPDNPRVYYNFYRHTALLTTSGNYHVTANLTYDGQTLKLEFPGQTWSNLNQLYIEQPSGNETDLQPDDYPVIVFTVVKLNGKQLILSLPDNKTYTFRKY